MKISILCITLIMLSFGTCSLAAEESMQYGRFGKLTIYRNVPHPSQVVLFVSGDGGWNLGVIDMARALAELDAMVVGLDITHYLKELARSSEKCSYPAADFENLSKFIQKKLGFATYIQPVLVGYSSGATLVYAVLSQSPPNTFRGAISLGFCPDLPLNKPFCAGHGLASEAAPKQHGYNFLPTRNLVNPWIAFQGEADQVCRADTVVDYVKQVAQAEIILLPKVGHGFSVQKNWLPQFRAAFAQLVKKDSSVVRPGENAGISDLPLIEVPVKTPVSRTMAVILTGDGGWASIDRDIGAALAAKGIPVVGLNTLKYFWTYHSPQEAGKDLERILRHYLDAWECRQAILIGYSLGADVLPFMTGYLPAELRQKVPLLALLGPATEATFEFHLNDWLGGGEEKGLPIAPEVKKIQNIKVLCLCGKEEKDSLCRSSELKSSEAKLVWLDGGHHFDGAYRKLTDLILAEARLQ